MNIIIFNLDYFQQYKSDSSRCFNKFNYFVTCVLVEGLNMTDLIFQENEVYRFQAVRKVMCELLSSRRQLLAGNLPRGPAEALRNQIASKLDWGNR